MSEANKYHFPGYPGGKQPKNPRNTFISNFNRSYSNGLANKGKRIPCSWSKHMEKSKSNFNLTEKAIKSLKIRQTLVKHIIKPTYGDISTFKGG